MHFYFFILNAGFFYRKPHRGIRVWINGCTHPIGACTSIVAKTAFQAVLTSPFSCVTRFSPFSHPPLRVVEENAGW